MEGVIMLSKDSCCKTFLYLAKCHFLFVLFISTFCLVVFSSTIVFINHAFAQESIEILSPHEGEMVISKKPEIKCQISIPYLQKSLYIQLDRTDITVLAEVTQDGFTLSPSKVLPPGNHTLLITFLDKNNAAHTKKHTFINRHSKMFEQISTTNNVSVIYSQVLAKMDDARTKSVSDWEVESNIGSKTIISEGPFEVSYATNARYTDQELSVSDPVEEGFTLVDYVINGKYSKGDLTLNASLGDVKVEGTRNVINSLSRRGGTLGAETSNTFLTCFSLRTQQIYGIDDSEDAEPDNKDHLIGVVGGISLLNKKMDVKLIYVTGGEQADNSSYGIWPDPAEAKGNAAGLEIKTDFFDKKMTTLVEYDFSDYDENTSDGIGSKSDKAFFGKVGGNINFFNYDVLYEYTGADYKIATSSLQQDRKGFTVKTGLSSQTQSIQFNYGDYNNNLDSNPTYARMDTLEYGANYNLNVISSLPVSMGWKRSLQDSSNEPAGASEIKNTTDTIFGSVSYIQGAWVCGVQPEYTQLDDETSVNYDTDSYTVTLFSSFTKERFSISPSISFNRFKDIPSDVKRDTLNYNLSASLNLYKGLDLEAAGSYGVLDSSNNSVDQDNLNGDIQLSYNLQKPIWGTFSPKLMLRASHDSSGDKVADTSSGETIVYLLISGSFDLSY